MFSQRSKYQPPQEVATPAFSMLLSLVDLSWCWQQSEMPGARISLPRKSAGCTQTAGWVDSTVKPSILIHQRCRLGTAGRELLGSTRTPSLLTHLWVYYRIKMHKGTVHTPSLPKCSQDVGRASIDPSVPPCPRLSQCSRLRCEKAK